MLVTYKGFLADGKVFDSNEGKEPISFSLGAGQVIRGWDRGLTGSCPGEQVVMIIPPSWATATRGRAPESSLGGPLSTSSPRSMV